MSRYSGRDDYLDPSSGVLKKSTLPDLTRPRSAAHAAGYYLAWENMRQPDVLQASVESIKGDTSKLTALIRDNLRAPEPGAAPPCEGHS